MSVCEEDRGAQPSSTNRVQKLYLVEHIKFMILFCTRSLLKLHISFIILYIFLHLQPQPTVSRNQVHDFQGECGLGKLMHGKLVDNLENLLSVDLEKLKHGKLVENYSENLPSPELHLLEFPQIRVSTEESCFLCRKL